MRAFVFASAISLALAGAAEAAPRRVASLKLCTDELVLMLAAPQQIASVTHLGHNPLESPLWREGRRYPKNDGTLMSVVPLRPDLVITMSGGASDRLRVAERLGIRTLDLPYPTSVADVERSIALVAGALGREEAGMRLLRQIAELRRTKPPAVDAAYLGGGGRSFAQVGLGAEWMALVGLRQRRLPGDRLTLETFLSSPPPVLLRSDYRIGQYSAEQRWLRHPLIRKAPRSRTIRTEGRRWTCMGPLMIGEVLRLRRELRR